MIHAMRPITTLTMIEASALAVGSLNPCATNNAATPLTTALNSTPMAPIARIVPMRRISMPLKAADSFSDASVLARSISLRRRPATSFKRPPISSANGVFSDGLAILVILACRSECLCRWSRRPSFLGAFRGGSQKPARGQPSEGRNSQKCDRLPAAEILSQHSHLVEVLALYPPCRTGNAAAELPSVAADLPLVRALQFRPDLFECSCNTAHLASGKVRLLGNRFLCLFQAGCGCLLHQLPGRTDIVADLISQLSGRRGARRPAAFSFRRGKFVSHRGLPDLECSWAPNRDLRALFQQSKKFLGLLPSRRGAPSLPMKRFVTHEHGGSHRVRSFSSSRCWRLEGQLQLWLRPRGPPFQRGQGNAEQPNALSRRKDRRQHQADYLFKLHDPPQEARNCLAAGDLIEVCIFDLERHRLGADAIGLAIGPHLFDQRLKTLASRFISMEVLGEGIFGADRFTHSVRLYLTLVDAARDIMEIGS
ncbi:hypothetical protein RHECNPAF_930091 [Rhizobium etli CNPAF512]|nr:hypothetical protein RHECNPAF_930091 [Rhizobium etli CNPAF512]